MVLAFNWDVHKNMYTVLLLIKSPNNVGGDLGVLFNVCTQNPVGLVIVLKCMIFSGDSDVVFAF